jgi:uncharacterized phage infection (PIP) family protein YhgE
VSETLRLVLTKFTDETITIFSMLLLVTMAGIIVYWFYNRKKFHQLAHEIPASVVKNYLDSIIQNSTSLKSSLFRGGGLDIGNGIPSVVPVGDLPSSVSIGVGSSLEEVNQKNAEIASLALKLGDRAKQISDLEKRIQEITASGSGKGNSDEANALKKDIAALQTQLTEARAASGGDPAIKRELTTVTNERNDLRERLKEYEIIEEDLANLKRLQQENDQLKAELASLRGGAPAPKVEIPAAAPIPTPTPVVEEEEIDLEAEMARAIAESKAPVKAAAVLEVAAETEPVVEGEQKSAEELLSEFEKMLG